MQIQLFLFGRVFSEAGRVSDVGELGITLHAALHIERQFSTESLLHLHLPPCGHGFPRDGFEGKGLFFEYLNQATEERDGLGILGELGEEFGQPGLFAESGQFGVQPAVKVVVGCGCNGIRTTWRALWAGGQRERFSSSLELSQSGIRVDASFLPAICQGATDGAGKSFPIDLWRESSGLGGLAWGFACQQSIHEASGLRRQSIHGRGHGAVMRDDAA